MDENAPLLETIEARPVRGVTYFSPLSRVYFTSLLLSMTFSFNAPTMLYSFRIMACQAYYESANIPPDEYCSIPEIDKAAAEGISLMVTGLTIAAVINLISCQWMIERYGVRFAMVQQTIWPALRNMCQIYGLGVGGSAGIWIMQYTQLLTVFGGMAGYMLVANAYVAELAVEELRTAAFGRVAGISMFGTAVALGLGGFLADYFGLKSPFTVALALLIFCTLFTAVFLPYIPPKPQLLSSKTTTATPDEITKDYPRRGIIFLLLGLFLAVFANAYVPTMLQLTATNSFGFGPTQNGLMMSINSLSRGCFLTFAFPRLVSWLRKHFYARSGVAHVKGDSTRALIATEDSASAELRRVIEARSDLFLCGMSIALDSVLTALFALATRGEHLWAGAIILPLTSGTAPACRGVAVALAKPAFATEILSAISFTEKLATMLTVSIFGFIFAYLTGIGRPSAVYMITAGVALSAAVILSFVRIPNSLKTATA